MKKKKRFLTSPIKQKMLILLASGVALGLTRSPRSQRYILRAVPKILRQINRDYLHRLMANFRENRLVDYKEEEDGNITVTLSELGQKQVLKFKLDEMTIKTPWRWDKKWRLVIFDIPEKHKLARESLRAKLKDLGFRELQHSVWVYPHDCEAEINFIVEVFDIRPYVRLIEALKITDEASLLLHFDLNK